MGSCDKLIGIPRECKDWSGRRDFGLIEEGFDSKATRQTVYLMW